MTVSEPVSAPEGSADNERYRWVVLWILFVVYVFNSADDKVRK